MKIPKIPLLILLILALLYVRTFHWLVHTWLTNPYYSHGILVSIISGFFAWRALRAAGTPQLEVDPVSSYQKGLIVLAAGLLLYAIGFIAIFPFLMAMSFLFTLSGLILYF
jgi:exosortase